MNTAAPPLSTGSSPVVSRYLQVAGAWTCFDCWEEHRQWRHTSTLGAVIAGLAAAELVGDAAAEHAEALRGGLADDRAVGDALGSGGEAAAVVPRNAFGSRAVATRCERRSVSAEHGGLARPLPCGVGPPQCQRCGRAIEKGCPNCLVCSSDAHPVRRRAGD